MCSNIASSLWELLFSSLLFSSLLFSSLLFSDKVDQHRLEFGLYAEYVQHDPIWSERNPPHDKSCLCWPHLSIFSTDHCNCCFSFHHPGSHLLLRVHVEKEWAAIVSLGGCCNSVRSTTVAWAKTLTAYWKLLMKMFFFILPQNENLSLFIWASFTWESGFIRTVKNKSIKKHFKCCTSGKLAYIQ